MNEERIISFIGTWSCFILANTSTDKMLTCIWLGFSMFWGIGYIYFTLKKK